ncbi:hypothetical protein GII33_22190 [Gordonia pseudamarae]|jgi:hypothetical protein|uniref:Antitoxin n=1 Tax=Gordonia pseudamarae TaxID=2831662 RepID=A0ABX6IN13_9ACTN|nr:MULTISPECIES: hypothetical protein [Gordonia]MBD0022275.1 hypothetical protein [Gordonia sp. (in: high G+C Gram-positive bacteria)]QHN28280.1 hypothetical protein GII33_22190 [Gordonia pseudamarae]QHN37142.1 hypothetical protein GII31_21820 [Gordonia pseudamarae]
MNDPVRQQRIATPLMRPCAERGLADQPAMEDWLADAQASASANPAVGVADILGDLEADRR